MSEAFRTLFVQSGNVNWPDDSVMKLSASHLQLEPTIILSLALRDIHNIGDVIKFIQSAGDTTYVHNEAITEALSRLFASVENGKTNWRAFWLSCGNQRYPRFYHLCATCEELERLSDTVLAMPVTREIFGNAGAMLARSGIVNIRGLRQRLLDGIDDVPGIGYKKLNDFFTRLARFVSAINTDGNISSGLFSADLKQQPSVKSDGKLKLTSHVTSLSVSILRLGGMTGRLREQKIETLGDLAEIWPLKHPNRYGLGTGSILKLGVNLKALQRASSEDDGISWDVYAEATGAELIPSAPPTSGPKDFLQKLPEILSEMAHALADPVLADILLNRLSKVPSKRKTLEQIASETVPRVTRQWINTKEKKLLKQIAGGLIWDEYGSLNLMFRAEFSEWWRRAAKYFEGQDEIRPEEFISGLAHVWNAEVSDIIPQLPIILAIVTGEVHLPSKFWAPSRLQSIYFGDLPDSTCQIPLSRLRLGKTASQLAEYGYETLGDVCEGCISGDLFSECPHPAKRVVEHLNLIRGAINDGGHMNWEVYVELQGFSVFPSNFRKTSNDFASHLIGDLAELIGHLRMPRRANDIFRLRTSLPLKSRMTLERVAEELESYGSRIKSEETKLLQNLNDVLIGRDYSNLPIWIDKTFLFYWEEAEAAYLLSENNFELFRELIGDCFSLPPEQINAVAPPLWAVISGYPNGRPSGKRRKKGSLKQAQVAEPALTGRIRLTGFRRVH